MSQKSQINVFSKDSNEKYEVFGNFLIKFSEEIDDHEKIKMLHSFTEVGLLNHEQNSAFDVNDFLKVLSKVPIFCETFLTVTCNSSSQEKHSIDLDILTRNLESASLCFEITQKSLETVNVMTQTIHVKVALNILFLGYTHCQDSEMIYGDLLEQFAHKLGIIFEKIECLQSVVLEKLNQLSSVKVFDDVPSVSNLVFELGKLCQVVSGLDDAAFDFWTIYIKLLSNHQYLIRSLDINPVLACLFSKNLENVELIKYNLDKETEQDDEIGKSFSFYLKYLANILNLSQRDLKENNIQFKMFLSSLLELLTLCFSPFVPEISSLSSTKDCLIKNTYDILSNFYTYAELSELLSLYKSEDLKTKEVETAPFLLNLCGLQFMKNSTEQVKEQVFRDILSSFTSNKTGNNGNLLCTILPRCAVTKTNSEESVDLYQLAYEQLSEFLKHVPNSVIHKLNQTVLVESTSCCDIEYLLISDTWIHRLRCSDTGFLRDLCYSALQQYPINSSPPKSKLDMFLKRMLKFLPHSEDKMLFEEFGALHFLWINDNIQHRHGTPDLFTSDYKFPNISDKKILEMMSKLNNCDGSDDLQLVNRSCLCLELCTLFINVSGSSEILQFVELADKMFKSEVYDIQVAVLTFIKLLSKKYLMEHSNEFGKIVTSMAKLFSSAIHSQNYLIHHEALSTFSYFARCTPHVRIVQETVRQDPSLKPLIKSYISAVPDTSFLTEEKKYQHLQEQMSQKNEAKFKISENSKKALLQIFSKQ